MIAAWHRGARKATRTAIQLVAAGGLTAGVNTFADGLSPNAKVYVLAGWTVLLALCQNALETKGAIPTLLPTPGIVPSAGGLATHAVGVVETAVDTVGGEVGGVEGTVEDLGGNLLGEIADVDSEDGQVGVILGVILVVLVLAMVGLFAICGDDEDLDGSGRVELVSQ